MCMRCVQAAAIYITINEITQTVKDDRPFRLSTLFANSIFRNIVIPLLATLGLYCLASLICVRICCALFACI